MTRPNRNSPAFPVISPDLQIAFSQRLQELRGRFLQGALQEAVMSVPVSEINAELQEYVPEWALQRLAREGLRGEVFFAVPALLRSKPSLLGYYRLLYGVSAKTFYGPKFFKGLQRLEESGVISVQLEEQLPEICRSLASTGCLLVEGLTELSGEHVHELQLLTLGPSLRGSELNRIGKEAVSAVYEIVKGLVKPYLIVCEATRFELRNASGNQVVIIFADDPDIRVDVQLPSGSQPLLSIEVKGGADASNVYNRLGEAEKSHLKARQQGYAEFWTIARARFSDRRAKMDSPTTNHFYRLDLMLQDDTAQRRQFLKQLADRLGIPTVTGRQ